MNASQLFIELTTLPQATELLIEADGLVLCSGAVGETDWPEATRVVLRDTTPEEGMAWRERDGVLWCGGKDLEATARQRDAWPDLDWLPRLVVDKPQVSYRFASAFPGEGFSVYQPDTATLRGYRVQGRGLRETLEQARGLGFEELWLHACDAEVTGRGLDLDLLERVRGWFSGELWLSGGARERRHLVNLAHEGGVAVVVVPEGLAAKEGVDSLRTALAPPPPPEAPVHFVGRGKAGHASTA